MELELKDDGIRLAKYNFNSKWGIVVDCLRDGKPFHYVEAFNSDKISLDDVINYLIKVKTLVTNFTAGQETNKA